MHLKTFAVSWLLMLFTILSSTHNIYAQTQKKGKDIGIQLYSVRSMIGSHTNPDEYADNYLSVLKKLSHMGYTSVEAAGYKDGMFYNTKPNEFKTTVEKAGMKVVSSHVSKALSQQELSSGEFGESLIWWKKAILAHQEAGIKYIVNPWIDFTKSEKELAILCLYQNEIGKLCKLAGIKYGYHNHAHEFREIENGSTMLDYMLQNTNPDYVFFEMDVYWTVIGDASPVDYFKKYPDRFKLLHIKDRREIGQSGMVGFDAIFSNAKTAGVEAIFVEFEEYTDDLESGLKQSIDYLQDAPFVKKKYL